MASNGIDFQSESPAIFGVTHLRLGANLALLNEEMQAHQISFFLARLGFKEQSGGTEIANA